jgi:NAD(P)-dependent dehydrogenase (short-subunit alcohol dehydrogenase family)
MSSLKRYKIELSEAESSDDLRSKLVDFYAQRTLTRRPILPQDCARAILRLASDKSARTTGHVTPVDGGLSEGFLQ